jgi:hypothetical protein
MSKSKKTHRLFISHSWAYGTQYDKIIEFLDNSTLNYSNHSVPKDDPIHTNGTDKELKAAIEAKIKGTSCIIILAGVYSSYSKWIKKEIDIAIEQGKSIIAIDPWASKKTSMIVKNNADIVVKWQSKSITDAIKKFG